MEHKAYVPEQVEGTHKDFKDEAIFGRDDDAEDAFIRAKGRLLNVNSWHQVTEGIPTRFQVSDKNGKPLARPLHKGDLVSINIPGPDHATGTGNDWVHVEELAYEDFPDQNREMIVLTLRPTSDPTVPHDKTSHFFTATSTSTFVLERINNKLFAHYYGRNEKPNSNGDGVIDTIRNTVVSIGAIAGFSDLQWKGLLRGFLS